MTERWVMVCGLVRNEANCEKLLTKLAEWRQHGHIDGVVVSWWHSETTRYPEIANLIEMNDFHLVEIEEPRIKSVGHTIHQAKTWWYALQAVPDNAFVLKIRPDIVTAADHILDSMIRCDLTFDDSLGWPTIFKHKIMIASAFPSAPYYYNDIIYYGHREDLLKLANFDLYPEYQFINTAPEQFFFSNPFHGMMNLLDAYMQIYAPFVFHDPVRSEKILSILLDSDFYLEALATNLRVLSLYFHVGFNIDSGDMPSQSAFSGIDLRSLLSADVGHPNIRHVTHAHINAFHDHAVIRAVLSGAIARDDLSIRLANAIEKTRDYGYVFNFSANPLRPAPGVRSLQGRLSREANLHHRLDCIQDAQKRKYLVRGEADRISVIGQEGTRHLEDEISHLRRIIDGMQK